MASVESESLLSDFAHQESKIVPFLLWIAMLALVARLTIFLRQRSEGEFAAIDSSAIAQICIVGFTCFLLLCSTRLKHICAFISRTSLGLLIAYYLLGAVSALWSPMPKYTLYRAFETISQLLAVTLALSFCHDFYKAERRVLLISFLTLMLEIIARLKFYGFSLSLSTWHTNSYSVSAAMIFCYCLGELLIATGERRKLLGFSMLAALFCLILGTSSGSYIAALCGIAFIGLIVRSRGILFVSLLIGIVLLLLLAERRDILFKAIFPGKDVETVQNLHGRKVMWERYAEKVREKPFLGHGGFIVQHMGPFAVNNTHNSIFSVLLGTGILGFGLVLLGLSRFFKEVSEVRHFRPPGFVGCIAAMIVCFVNSMNLPIIWDQWRPPYLVFACFLCLHTLYLSPGLGDQYAAE